MEALSFASHQSLVDRVVDQRVLESDGPRGLLAVSHQKLPIDQKRNRLRNIRAFREQQLDDRQRELMADDRRRLDHLLDAGPAIEARLHQGLQAFQHSARARGLNDYSVPFRFEDAYGPLLDIPTINRAPVTDVLDHGAG